MAKRKKFYAVARGHVPGIYTEWFGANGAEAQVRGVKNALYRGFPTREEARQWLEDPETAPARPQKSGRSKNGQPSAPRQGDLIIYTDGGCINNPGPGGYGVVVLNGEGRKEFSGGYRRTTNNRMEILACIVGLQALEKPSRVTLYSDSRYVVDAVTKGWARKWRSRNWTKGDGNPALNSDLWEKLLKLIDYHDVQFVWVKGHAGTTENERCDQLANTSARQEGLPADRGYE